MRYVNQKMLAIRFSSRINDVGGWGGVFSHCPRWSDPGAGAMGGLSIQKKTAPCGAVLSCRTPGRNTFGGEVWYQPATSRQCLEEECMKRRNFLTGALVAAAMGVGAMASTPVYASPENPVIGFPSTICVSSAGRATAIILSRRRESWVPRSMSSRLTAMRKSRSSRLKT